MQKQSTRKTGADSEQAACEFLLSLGYEIIQRNYYCRDGELDIVARIDSELAFVEVKSIVEQPEVSPFELLSKLKLRRVERSIEYWLMENQCQSAAWHFEYIAVVLTEDLQVKQIEHIPQPELYDSV